MPARIDKDRLASWARRIPQVLAILALAFICLVILHKGYTDVTALAKENARGDFWPALMRYVFRNMAGG